jgi:cell division protein FtsB
MVKRNYLKAHSKSRTVWRKRLIVIGAILVAFAGLWKFIVGEMGVVKYYRMSAHARDLRSEIDHLRTDNARLSQEVAALKTDPAFIERLARDKIGLARPGEVVYYYGDTAR